MTEIHQVKCDKCGVVKNMREGYGYHKLPLRWINVEQNWLIDYDLCPKCKKLFKNHSKEFFK